MRRQYRDRIAVPENVYANFFAIAPAGQDYFKQSNKYLHLIATKALVMTIDMHKDPASVIDLLMSGTISSSDDSSSRYGLMWLWESLVLNESTSTFQKVAQDACGFEV